MTIPDGITKEAWEAATGCWDAIPDGSYLGAIERIASAIQAAQEAERARISKEVARVVDTLPTEGTVAQTLRTATAIDRIFAAIKEA